MDSIGDKIKELRLAANMSADDLADAMGRTGVNKKQYVYDLEQGRIKRLDLETLTRISKIFNVKLSHFLDSSKDSDEPVKSYRTKVTIDGNTVEAIWKEKYYASIIEISDLKSQISELKSEIIELLKRPSG